MRVARGNKRLMILVILLPLALFLLVVRPSNERNWAADQRVLPSADVDGEQVHLQNIRDFTYRSTDDYDVRYRDQSFDLDAIESVWYVVEPFSDWEGAAHTFLSFGFENGEYVGISIEIRKEEGEEFSTWKGLLRRYELMYVIGTERDLIGLRANHRRDDVFLYPVKATPEQTQTLFLHMLARVNALREKPEFYNTLFNTCTTNIVGHINAVFPGTVPFDVRILFPGYSDRFAYELGLLDTDLPFEEARAHFKINDRAAAFADDPDFSSRIRAFTRLH